MGCGFLSADPAPWAWRVLLGGGGQVRGPQSTPGGAPVSGAQVSKGISLTKQTPTPPRRPELPHRSRVSCPLPVVCTGGPWPRGLEVGGGLRQVRAGVDPRGGLGRVKGGEGRGTGGVGWGSLGPCPLPSAVQEQRGFLGGLSKVGPRWSLPGKLPQGYQAPRAECVPAEVGPPPSAASGRAQRGDAQGSREPVPGSGHDPWSQGHPGPLTLAFW